MLVVPVLDEILEVVDRLESNSNNNNGFDKLRNNVKSLRQDLVKMYEVLEKEKEVLKLKLELYGSHDDDPWEKDEEFMKLLLAKSLETLAECLHRGFIRVLRRSESFADDGLRTVREWEERKGQRRSLVTGLSSLLLSHKCWALHRDFKQVLSSETKRAKGFAHHCLCKHMCHEVVKLHSPIPDHDPDYARKWLLLKTAESLIEF